MAKDSVRTKVKEHILDRVPNLDEDDLDGLVDELAEVYSGDSYNDDQGRGYYHGENIDSTSRNFGLVNNDPYAEENDKTDRPPPVACVHKDANLIGSRIADDLHKPVLDFDFPIHIEDSLTEGHYHLYIDKPISDERFERLLWDLRAARLVEPGWIKNYDEFGQVFVRTPKAISDSLEEHNGGKQLAEEDRF